MRTKFIFKTIQILSIFMLGIFTNAQTGTLTLTSPYPANVNAGDNASFTLNYTSSVPSRIDIALYKSTADGSGPDFNAYIAGSSQTGLPATATASSKTITVTVPANTPASSTLGGSYTYYWGYFLKSDDGNYTYIAGTSQQTTINASGTPPTVSDAISFNGTPPSSAAPGSTPNVAYQYTSSTGDKITKIGLDLFGASGYISDVVADYVNPAAMTTATPVSKTSTFTIPAGITPSASLPAGQYYKWEVAIYKTGFAYISGSSTPVTITGSLGTSETKNIRNEIYPNPVENVVNFTKSSEVKTVEITDLSGRMILNKTKDFSSGLNVSSLKKGVYLITINGNDTQKLLKK